VLSSKSLKKKSETIYTIYTVYTVYSVYTRNNRSFSKNRMSKKELVYDNEPPRANYFQVNAATPFNAEPPNELLVKVSVGDSGQIKEFANQFERV